MMKIKIVYFYLLFIFLATVPAFAETTIKAEVDKTSITTDEELTYKIIITSSEKNLPAPQVPKFSGFNVISQAQSSTLSFMKSETKTILVYAFILVPAQVGKIKIEPSSIKLKNKVYSSQSFEVEVAQGKTLPKSTQPESKEPQYTL